MHENWATTVDARMCTQVIDKDSSCPALHHITSKFNASATQSISQCTVQCP